MLVFAMTYLHCARNLLLRGSGFLVQVSSGKCALALSAGIRPEWWQWGTNQKGAVCLNNKGGPQIRDGNEIAESAKCSTFVPTLFLYWWNFQAECVTNFIITNYINICISLILLALYGLCDNAS
jgi:hypothetical protein